MLNRQLPTMIRGGWHLSVTVAPTVVTAALPKCPICLMAALSSIGLGSHKSFLAVAVGFVISSDEPFYLITSGAKAELFYSSDNGTLRSLLNHRR